MANASSGNMNSPDTEQNNLLNIFVLHQNFIDCCTGTDGKVPCMSINIYQLHPFRQIRNFIKAEKIFSTLSFFEAKVVKELNITLAQRIEKLNYYTKLIVPQPDFAKGSHGYKDDLIYIVSNISIYAFRQKTLERQTLAEVKTSSLCKITEELNRTQAQEEKKIPGPKESAAQGSVPKLPPDQVTVINKQDLELRFDGCTRFHVLPNNRLLIIMENQDKYVVHFQFDQADIDVDLVEFVKIKTPTVLVPSSLAVSSIGQLTGDANKAEDEFIVFVSSYFKDQQLMKLSANFDPVLQIEEGQPQKRQRLLSSDSIQSQAALAKKKTTKSSSIPDCYDLKSLDQLTTLAPITGIMELPGKSQPGVHSDDLLLSSGHSQSAALTIVKSRSNGYLAMHQDELLKISGMKAVNTIALNHEDQLKQFIILSTQSTTRLLEFSGRLTELKQNSETFVVDESTIFCQKMNGQNQILQVTPKKMVILKYDFEDQKFSKVSECHLNDQETFVQAVLNIDDYQASVQKENQTTFFALIYSELANKNILRAFNADDLSKSFDFDFIKQDIQVTTTFSIEKTNFVAVVTNDQSNICSQNLLIMKNKENAIDRYETVWACEKSEDFFSQLNMQSAVISRDSDWIRKSLSDLTLDVQFKDEQAAQNGPKNPQYQLFNVDHNLIPRVVDFQVSSATSGKDSSDKVFMTLVYNNAKINVYEMPVLNFESPSIANFKLVKSQALNRFQNMLEADSVSKGATKYVKCIHKIENQTMVLFNNLIKVMAHDQQITTQTLVITERKGRLLFNQMPQPDFQGIVSLARIQVQSKGTNKVQKFMCVLRPNLGESEESSLCMGQNGNVFQFFDVRQSSLVSDGVSLKQYPFDNKGIKSFCIHKNQYLVVATYQKIPTKTAPQAQIVSRGFSPNNNNMANDFKYQIEVYRLPTHYSNQDKSGQKQNWKELQKLEKEKMLCVYSNKFQDDELISSLQSITLDIQNANEINASGRIPEKIPNQEEFLIASTITLDKNCEKVHFPSSMQIFQISQSPNQAGLQIQLMQSNPQKRLVSCIKAYRGKLLTVTYFPKGLQRDFWIATQGMQFNVGQQQSHDQQISEVPPKFVLDQDPQWNPQSIQNMSKFVSVEEDYIFVADIYKNFQVFKLMDAEELEKQKTQDKSLISLGRPRFQAKSDSHCMAVYPMIKLSQGQDIKHAALFSASQEGTIRLYTIKYQKNLECSSQLNLKDNILRVLQVPLMNSQLQTKKNEELYAFMVVTRRAGIQIVKPCSFHQFQTLKALMVQMSELLPFTAGVTPVMAMKGFQSSQQLGSYHSCLTGCVRNLRALHLMQDRQENSDDNMAIDSRPIVDQFLSLNICLQSFLAKKIGFDSVVELQKVLIS